MSVWGLISEASLVVQAVMVILVLASVSSWYLIIRRSAVLRRSERLLRSFQQRFRQGGDLAQLYREGNSSRCRRRPRCSEFSWPVTVNSPNSSVKRALLQMPWPRVWNVACTLPLPSRKNALRRACNSSPRWVR